MFTEGHAELSGNSQKIWLNITFITYLMRQMGHRRPLLVELGAKKEPNTHRNGQFEEVGAATSTSSSTGTAIAFSLRKAAPKMASSWSCSTPPTAMHACGDTSWPIQILQGVWSSRLRHAVAGPISASSGAPADGIPTDKRLVPSHYPPLLRRSPPREADTVGCSMGGYIMFYVGYHEPERYRAFIAVAACDLEPHRWVMERVFPHTAISFNRALAATSRGLHGSK